MEITDLMVGDWVSYLGFYNKVIYIGQKVSMYDGKGTEFTTDPEHIRPIPLTEEILVKNGWRKHIMLYNNEWYGDIGLFEEHGKFYYMDLKIEYVHQLQHLLRLCGIEKELTI